MSHPEKIVKSGGFFFFLVYKGYKEQTSLLQHRRVSGPLDKNESNYHTYLLMLLCSEVDHLLGGAWVDRDSVPLFH